MKISKVTDYAALSSKTYSYSKSLYCSLNEYINRNEYRTGTLIFCTWLELGPHDMAKAMTTTRTVRIQGVNNAVLSAGGLLDYIGNIHKYIQSLIDE